MNDKFLTLLGFAAKAGKLSYGFDAANGALSKKKSKLVLVACDISPKSKKEILFFCDKAQTQAVVLKAYDMDALSRAVGRKCGIISVNDVMFSDGIKNAIGNLCREEIK